MDFDIGDIIEHETDQAQAPVPDINSQNGGFPKLKTFDFKKKSRFRTNSRNPSSQLTKQPMQPTNQPSIEPSQKSRNGLSESAEIHKENMEKLSKMTDEEISKERAQLFESFDPKLLAGLLKRAESKLTAEHHHAEGYSCENHSNSHTNGSGAHLDDGWIGGGRNGATLPPLDSTEIKRAFGEKSVSFAPTHEVSIIEESENREILEDIEDIEERSEELEQISEQISEQNPFPDFGFDDNINEPLPQEGDDQIAPEGYQILQETAQDSVSVHFPKPKMVQDDPDLDLNDPNFFDQLHEKYFPDLPRETSKLAWMTEPVPLYQFAAYEAISDMRFDFKGSLVELDPSSQNIPSYMGLHHHSENPQLAGYSLPELLHLSRSVVPTQRCLGIQMLGRILHKLGLHKYNILPIGENPSEEVALEEISQTQQQFEQMMWDLIEQLRIVESLTDASDEKLTKNLSVRNYAIEALWLWKQGGGRPEPKSEIDVVAEHLQKM